MASLSNLKASLAALDISMAPTLDDLASSNGLSSPTDSEVAEKNLAALDRTLNEKLQISREDASQAKQDPLVHDAAANSTIATSGANPNFSNDPLSATALVSPLHTLSWDAILTAQNANNSLNGIASSSSGSTGSFDNFKRAGPHFPPSLEKLIMDYHHRHSKSWQLAHDMGAGSGVYSPALAKYFRHVHVSDPSATGITTSRRLLSSWAAANRKSRGRFTFSTQIPERGHESLADGSADFALVLQGAHFADPTALVLSAGESLAPGGTLAVVAYSPLCRVAGNPRADAAAQKLFAAWGPAAWDVVCGGDAKGKQKFALGLDFVPVPEHLFAVDKTRRITINNTSNGSGFAVPGFAAEGSESRVRSGERRHDYSSEEEQAKGWRQEVGPEFFRSLTAALLGSAKAGQFEENFKEIAQVVHETSANGIIVDVEWSVAVVLATRK